LANPAISGRLEELHDRFRQRIATSCPDASDWNITGPDSDGFLDIDVAMMDDTHACVADNDRFPSPFPANGLLGDAVLALHKICANHTRKTLRVSWVLVAFRITGSE
jgi:hypothetical protein